MGYPELTHSHAKEEGSFKCSESFGDLDVVHKIYYALYYSVKLVQRQLFVVWVWHDNDSVLYRSGRDLWGIRVISFINALLLPDLLLNGFLYCFLIAVPILERLALQEGFRIFYNYSLPYYVHRVPAPG